MMKKSILGTLLLMVFVFALATVTEAQDATQAVTQEPTPAPVTQVQFQPVNGSGVTGFVLLQPQSTGTFINVIAFGLPPDGISVSLYYDNHTCTLKADSASSDRVGNIYVGNRVGVGVTEGMVGDSFDQIDSVSVRKASDLTLLACADVQP